MPDPFEPVEQEHEHEHATSAVGQGHGTADAPGTSGSDRGRRATHLPDRAAAAAERIPSHWRRLLFGRMSFLPVLILAVLVILTAPILDEWKFGYVLVFPFSGALVVLAFHRGGLGPRSVRMSLLATTIAGTLVIIASVARTIRWGQDNLLVATSAFMFAALMAIAFPTVVRQAFTHRRVDVNTVAAGITAYLLIGIFFASMFRAVSALDGYHLFAQPGIPAAGDYTYFSFITLTTVGYGDFTPGTDTARSLAIAEAIMGQIFLVTAVARIMSLYGTERSSQRDAPARRTFDEEAD